MMWRRQKCGIPAVLPPALTRNIAVGRRTSRAASRQPVLLPCRCGSSLAPIAQGRDRRSVGRARHRRPRVVADRLHRIRWAARAYHAAAQALRGAAPLVVRRGVRGWRRHHEPAARARLQLAIFCAWRLAGPVGAIVGGACFIMPGLAAILALAVLFLAAHPPSWVAGAAGGAGAAVPAVATAAATGL